MTDMIGLATGNATRLLRIIGGEKTQAAPHRPLTAHERPALEYALRQHYARQGLDPLAAEIAVQRDASDYLGGL